jgi:hypothetical protein
LPPGVSEGMIPGNRPEDLEDDAFFEALDAQLRREHPESAAVIDELWENHEDALVDVARLARGLGYNSGYADGQLEANTEGGKVD